MLLSARKLPKEVTILLTKFKSVNLEDHNSQKATEGDNHKHNILSPLATNVKIIFRRKGLKRVHYKGTFSVSSHNK